MADEQDQDGYTWEEIISTGYVHFPYVPLQICPVIKQQKPKVIRLKCALVNLDINYRFEILDL